MFVSIFGDLRYRDKKQLREWLAAHDLKHQALAQAAGRQGVQLPSFLMADTMDDYWVQTHYQQHATLTTLPGVGQSMTSSIYDLLTNPMMDESTFYEWHSLHDTIHTQLDQAFGIT